MSNRIKDTIAILAVFSAFAIIGPFVPISIVILIVLFSGGYYLVPWVLIVGYSIGILPSVLASVIYCFLSIIRWPSISTLPGYVKGLISGAVSSVVFISSFSNIEVMLAFLSCCIISGAVCGYLFKLPKFVD